MFEELKDEQVECQTLVIDEEEHELSLSASFTLLEETHDPTPMEPTLGIILTFIDLEDELVHHTSSYTTTFSLHPSEVWVKWFFVVDAT